MAIRLSSSRMDMNDKPLERPVIRDYGEAVNALGGGSGTRNIDLSLGNVVTATVTGTITFTFSNPTPAGTACTFTLLLTNGGAHTVNWPSAVKWANTENNVAPTLNTAGVDILTFLTTDVGITWYGFVGSSLIVGDTLWAFGAGTDGRLGDSTITAKSSPTQVGTNMDWATVAAGTSSSHAIRADGTLWSWGLNSAGQLGTGNTTTVSSPVQVGLLTTWDSVVTATGLTGHSLALKTDGTLWAWGSNAGGKLGVGNTTNRSSPTQVGSLTTWSKAVAGRFHSLALKTDGTLWAWGNNNYGSLGTGNNTSHSSPVQIGSLTTWVSVSAGVAHSLAIKTDGTLWAWGYNDVGALGHGNLTNRSSPTQVGSLATWSAISAGYGTSFALKADGTLWAWGEGSSGQLGQGTSAVDRSSPVQVGSLTTWSQIDAGESHILALKTDGTLWAWGNNGSGRLGDGTAINRSSPVQIGTLNRWREFTAGDQHSLAIKKE